MRLSPEHRKILLHVKQLRREQIKDLEKLIIPLRDNLKLLDEVLQSKRDVREFLQSSKQVTIYLRRLKL